MIKPIPDDCVVFDTETTGFSPDEGDKLVEVGAVRMRDGLPTKETFHTYINPMRSVPQGAVDVHGLTAAFLSDKPLFIDIAPAFLEFVGGDHLVAHNAQFDKRFINAELRGNAFPAFADDRFIDTIPIAKKRFPGAQVNLDALCRRFKISLAGRGNHGALIDSILLAEVCVELCGGRQSTLFGGMTTTEQKVEQVVKAVDLKTFVRHATVEEQELHAALVKKLGPDSIWAQIGAVA